VVNEYVVTVVGGSAAFDFGPSVVVEAESEQDAASVGVAKLAAEDSGLKPWGVTCESCEKIAIDRVMVFAIEAGEVFVQSPRWSLKS
jgi:hypothetical protein